jgi:hypothetical protein
MSNLRLNFEHIEGCFADDGDFARILVSGESRPMCDCHIKIAERIREVKESKKRMFVYEREKKLSNFELYKNDPVKNFLSTIKGVDAKTYWTSINECMGEWENLFHFNKMEIHMDFRPGWLIGEMYIPLNSAKKNDSLVRKFDSKFNSAKKGDKKETKDGKFGTLESYYKQYRIVSFDFDPDKNNNDLRPYLKKILAVAVVAEKTDEVSLFLKEVNEIKIYIIRKNII